MNWHKPFIISCKPACSGLWFWPVQGSRGLKGAVWLVGWQGICLLWWGLKALMKVDMNLQNTISLNQVLFSHLDWLFCGVVLLDGKLVKTHCEHTVVKDDLLDWRDGPGDFAEENICYFLNFLLLKASTSCFGFVILLFWLRLFLLLAACVDLRDLVWTRCKLSIIFHQPLWEFWPCCCCTLRNVWIGEWR